MTGHRILGALCLLLAAGVRPGRAADDRLTIVVLEGEGALNNIKRRLARDPVVEVRDENNRVVVGAKVFFTLPEGGASGMFPGGSRTFAATTDATGRANTKDMKPNTVEGRFNIKVVATLGQKSGSAIIAQSNTLAGGVVVAEKSSSKKKWIIIAVVIGAAAAGGGAYFALHSSGSPAAAAAQGPVSTTLSVGTITVGGPQ